MQQKSPFRPRTTIHPRFYLFLLAFALIIAIAYLLLSGGSGSYRRGSLVTVGKNPLGSQYQGQAVIARDETLIAAESITSIKFIADEGAMVTKNSTLCSVYSAGYNQIEIDRLNKARTEIQSYHREKMSRNYGDPELSKLEDTISSLSQEVRTLVQRAGQGSFNNLEKQLKDALQARKEHLRSAFPDDNTLISYYESERSQERKIESWTTTFPATSDCLVSFYTDGYETTVNSQTFASLTPAQVRAVLAGQQLEMDIAARGRQPIYRTVNPEVWYVLLLCDSREWAPAEGQAYKMQPEGFENYLIDATVLSSTRLGSEILVRMQVNASVVPMLNIRTCRMVVGEYVDGLSVPIEAVIEQGGMRGVVVSDGTGQMFVPVTVISHDGKAAYIRPTYAGSLLEGQQVLIP